MVLFVLLALLFFRPVQTAPTTRSCILNSHDHASMCWIWSNHLSFPSLLATYIFAIFMLQCWLLHCNPRYYHGHVCWRVVFLPSCPSDCTWFYDSFVKLSVCLYGLGCPCLFADYDSHLICFLSVSACCCTYLSFSLANRSLEGRCWHTQQRKIGLSSWIDFYWPEPI